MVNKSVKKLATNQRKQWLTLLEPTERQTETGNTRVLIDTNVWYSGILYGGKPELVIRYCKQHFQIVSSKYLIDELLEHLKDNKTPYKWRNRLEVVLKRVCTLVEPADIPKISRDPDDDPVIAAALVGDCQFLITSDNDLLGLGEYKGINILTPSEFLKNT